MDLANALLDLKARWYLVLVIMVLAAAAGILVAYKVHLSPLGLESRSLSVGAARTTVMLDSAGIASVAAPSLDAPDPFETESLRRRAQLLARLMGGAELTRAMAERLDVDPADIGVAQPTDPLKSGQERLDQDVGQRVESLVVTSSPYQLTIEDSTQAPVITFLAQAPDTERAIALAAAAADALKDKVTDLREDALRVREDRLDRQRKAEKPLKKLDGFVPSIPAPFEDVRLDILGPPTGGTLTKGANVPVAVAAGLFALLLGLLTIVGLAGLGRGLADVRAEREAASRNGHPPEGRVAPPAAPVTAPPAPEPAEEPTEQS